MAAFPTPRETSRAAEHGFQLPVRLEHPSKAFRTFVEQHFLDVRYGLRRENDLRLLDKLSPEERAAALTLIEANIHTGAPWLVWATACLGMKHLVPALQRLLDATASPSFELLSALRSLAGLSLEQLFSLQRTAMLEDGELAAIDILDNAWVTFPLARAAELVALALVMPNYSVRCHAYSALLAMEAIARGGGVRTPEITRAIRDEERLWAMVGSGYPNRYQQFQHYVGDAVYREPERFADRVAELRIRLATAVSSART